MDEVRTAEREVEDEKDNSQGERKHAFEKDQKTVPSDTQ